MELVVSIKILIVLAVAAFYLAIMPGCERSDFFMLYPELSQCFFKERKWLVAAIAHLVGKFKTVICLDTLDCVGKLFYNVLEKLRGRVSAVLLKGFQIPETVVFINESVLIPPGAVLLTDNTGLRDEFDVNLHTLTGILHLLVGFWDILWIWQLDRLAADPAQQLMQS